MASERYGLITVEDAAQLGIHRKQLLVWEAMGRLERCGRGVYRLDHYLPTPYDHYAEAIALVGRGAVIYGDAVLAMHNLGRTDSSCRRETRPQGIARVDSARQKTSRHQGRSI